MDRIIIDVLTGEKQVVPLTAQELFEAQGRTIIENAEQATFNAEQTARAQAFIDNLPSWALVGKAVDDIGSLAEAKAFIKKLARIVYWLAKGTSA